MKLAARLFSVFLIFFVASRVFSDDEKHSHAAGDPERLGKVNFKTSCSPAAQRQFNSAVAMLHSFWYDEALKAFAGVAQTDPKCAMSHWGVAMSLYEPIWEPADEERLKKGREAVEKARIVGLKTDRERDYVAAIEVFYKGSETLDHRTRALAYEKAMKALSERYPKDREASVFYALSLLGTALPADKTYANQKKAGEILEKVFKVGPDHPGVAHYIIHSYDYPPLASRALAAARKYSKIAPASPHALHMPSHIFTRLGLWEESIESNIASAAAAKAHVSKTQPGSASFDQVHAMDYLTYAYLQQGRVAEAERVLEELQGVQKLDRENVAAAYALTAIPARFTVERRRWSEVKSLSLEPDFFPWSRYPWAEGTVRLARALGFARSGNAAAARPEIERLGAIRQVLMEARNSYWADQAEIWRREASGWLAQAEGKSEEAVELLRSAAELEDATEKHPVTPGPLVPAREMLADLLLEQRQPGKAMVEYETALQVSPNRFNALYGAARAAQLAGNLEKARTHFAGLVSVSGAAQTARPELEEARAFLAKK